jgi:hypothetical protein
LEDPKTAQYAVRTKQVCRKFPRRPIIRTQGVAVHLASRDALQFAITNIVEFSQLEEAFRRHLMVREEMHASVGRESSQLSSAFWPTLGDYRGTQPELLASFAKGIFQRSGVEQIYD